ncbi:hypothetical protein PCASD_01894 [Puccinia coronata f. sp. avenae]|uniref:Uncharacterized protein n=1 Tax=Puccinia coronata f. sp. avenae TaxID=200324 RepID=A0A2N5VJE9_9BASI|nr:hypothetical protein PCASD_01894 [Puccinia coronata f. sp. avenae]
MDQGLPLFSDMPGDLEGGGFSGSNTTSRRGPMASGSDYIHNGMNTPQLPPRPPEPIQRPFRRIKDPDLYYELGGNFNQFLQRYEQAADFFGCSEYKMAMQIGRFMKTEDLLTALEYMDRYDNVDWKQLQAEMIELWGEVEGPPLLNTTQDLLKLKEEVFSQGGITNYQEFKDYLKVFSEILDYLVRTEQVGRKKEVTCLFVQSFTPEIQNKIIRNLSINGKIRQQPNGTWKNPLWNDTIRAAENEIRLEEELYYQSMLEPQLLDEEQSNVECHSRPLDQEDFPREPTMDNNTKSENNKATEVNLTEIEAKLTKQEEKIPELVEQPEKQVLTPEWRAQALEMIDTPMEMKHIVIEIPGLDNAETELDNVETELDDVETELDDVEMELDHMEMEVDRGDTEKAIEAVPNQPVQQEESNQSSQSKQINSTIQELKLTIEGAEDPRFSTKTPINWIQQIIKRKLKIFNKQLFKPHLDLIRFQFLKDLHQGVGSRTFMVPQIKIAASSQYKLAKFQKEEDQFNNVQEEKKAEDKSHN